MNTRIRVFFETTEHLFFTRSMVQLLMERFLVDNPCDNPVRFPRSSCPSGSQSHPVVTSNNPKAKKDLIPFFPKKQTFRSAPLLSLSSLRSS